MLKKSASIVLASFRSSTYPRGYASGLHSLRPCWTAFLSILRADSSLLLLLDSMRARSGYSATAKLNEYLAK